MATTWTSTGTRSVRADCTTGTEAVAVLGANDGMNLDGVEGFSVYAEADNAQTFTGGTINFFMQNPRTGKWADCDLPAVTLPASGKAAYASSGFDVDVPVGRVAALPSGVTPSGGALHIHLVPYVSGVSA